MAFAALELNCRLEPSHDNDSPGSWTATTPVKRASTKGAENFMSEKHLDLTSS